MKNRVIASELVTERCRLVHIPVDSADIWVRASSDGAVTLFATDAVSGHRHCLAAAPYRLDFFGELIGFSSLEIEGDEHVSSLVRIDGKLVAETPEPWHERNVPPPPAPPPNWLRRIKQAQGQLTLQGYELDDEEPEMFEEERLEAVAAKVRERKAGPVQAQAAEPAPAAPAAAAAPDPAGSGAASGGGPVNA